MVVGNRQFQSPFAPYTLHHCSRSVGGVVLFAIFHRMTSHWVMTYDLSRPRPTDDVILVTTQPVLGRAKSTHTCVKKGGVI